jgi:trimeric autotransporter adhesin
MRTTFLLAVCFAISYVSSAQTITTIAGSASSGYSGDGAAATLATLTTPQGIAVDTAGNVYIADVGNNVIRKVSSSGIIVTIAGTGTAGYNGDSIAATAAQLNTPRSVAVDRAGNVYIADQINNRIRKVDASGMITTYAGNGTSGFSGDGAPATAAEIFDPYGIAVDDTGNVYFADFGNARIRKVDTWGIINTMGGGGSSYADTVAADSARILYPAFVAVDSVGNIYFSDHFRNIIRRIDPSGVMTRIVGDTVMGYSGDGGAADTAELNFPYGVAVDRGGNLYIADYYNNRIRKVTAATGIISTMAGDGTPGFAGDGSAATAAELHNPVGVAVDAHGDVYIGDNANDRVRKVSPDTVDVSLTVRSVSEAGKLLIYPDPASSVFNVVMPVDATGTATVTITDMTGRSLLMQRKVVKPGETLSYGTAGLSPGNYIVIVVAGAVTYRSLLVIN